VRGGYERLAQYRSGISMRIFVIAAALISTAAAQGTLFVGTWPHTVQVVDEKTQKVVDHIDLQTGTSHSMLISDDRKTIYASTIEKNGIEVIDVATRKVTNSFVLDEGGKKMRFNAWAPDPSGKLIYMIVRPIEKKIDRFEVGKSQFAIVDLAQKKIVKFVDMPGEDNPNGNGGRGGALRFSPDGKYLYRMGGIITIYDTSDFKVVDTIELSKPQFPGMQNVNLSQQLDGLQEPGVLVSLFNSSDPVIHKQMFGIARFDLDKRTFQFTPIGPSVPSMQGLHITPDRKIGYTVTTSGTPGNKRSEFWVLDIPTGKVIRTQEFDGRARYTFGMSSTGKDLYIYGAGYDIEVYDPATLKMRSVIDLNADQTTGMIVVPGK
jgi:DNA-binding beta-propeller fold protein YncE